MGFQTPLYELAEYLEVRADDFDRFFAERRERLCRLVEDAIGKAVQRDVDAGEAVEGSERFDIAMVAEAFDEED